MSMCVYDGAHNDDYVTLVAGRHLLVFSKSCFVILFI